MSDYEPSPILDIVNLLPDPVVVLDTKGTIQWCNAATYQVSQFNKEDLIGSRFTKMTALRLRNVPKYVKIFASILRGDSVEPFGVTWDKVDGTIQESEVHIERITTPKGKKAILVVARNITGQEEMREAYRLARFSIDNAADPIFWVDDNANFVYANEAACNVLQYSLDELTEMKVHDIDPGYPKERWPSFIKEFEGNVHNFAYMTDITERKIAEETLLQSEEQNRIIVDSMSDLVLIYDKDVRLIEYYTSDESLLYMPWKDMEGRRLEEFMPSAYTDIHYKNVQQVKETGEDVIFEYELEASGISRWFQGTMVLRRDGESIVVVVKEITEGKKTEIALARSEKRFRGLFLNATVGLFRTGEAGDVLECNLAGAKLFGYNNPEEIIEDYNLSEHYVDPKRRQDLLDELSELGEVSNFQAQITKRDGTPIWTELSSKWYPEEGFLETVAIDITQRKETEEKLKESEERYRSLVEHIPDVAWTTDSKGNTSYISPNVLDVYGFTSEEIFEAGDELWFGRIHPDNVEYVKREYEALFKTGKVMNIEYRIQRKDGIWIWLHDRSYGTYEREGEILASGVFSDITDRRRAEEKLKESEERQRVSAQRYLELLEHLPAGVAIADLDEKSIFVNPAFCEIVGYESDELIGMNVIETIASEDHEKIHSETEFRKTGQSSTYEIQVARKDGALRDVRISAVPDRDDDGEIIGTIGLLIDISEAKRAEEALMASERRLSNLIEQLPLGVSIANVSEKVELANQALAEMILQEQEKLIGSNLIDYLHPDYVDLMREQTKSRMKGVKSTYDVEMIRTDGAKRDVRVFAAPNYDKSGRISGSVGIFEDITDQIQNETIRAQQEREIDLYGSLLRHDLRNDLGLILSYMEAVQMLVDSPDDDINSFLNSGIATVERMANLLTNFGRPQDVREVDVVEFIREIADEAQEAEKNLHINASYEEKTKPTTLMAGSLLALVFMNLFRNSAQHAGESPMIDVQVARSEGQLDITVSDNGPGVPEEFQDKLFARGTSSKGEAGGLGLHLCKQIIERIGGSIELDKDAKGATFQLELPVEV